MSTTTYLELEDQATGANDGTWGDVADSNYAIVELAIARVAGIATTGGTTVLTSVQNRYPLIVLTGVLVANATIQTRTAEKNWIFINRTTGAFSVTVKTAAGTGVTLPRQKAVKLYCDGTNVVYARYPNVPHAAADLQEGLAWLVTAGAPNTLTNPTFNPDGLGPLTITKFGGQALAAGDIRAAGHKLLLIYKSTGVELLNPATDASNYALKNADNAFSVAQTTSITNADTTQTVVIETLTHLSSAVPAPGFGIEIRGRLHNALNAIINAGSLVLAWVTATSGAEDSRWEFWTDAAGAGKAMVAYIQKGLVLGAATGGDKGLGTINATGYYQNGAQLGVPHIIKKAADQTYSSSALANDADFAIAVAANTKYFGEIWLYSADWAGSSGLKVDMTGPAAPTSFSLSVQAGPSRTSSASNADADHTNALSNAINLTTNATDTNNFPIAKVTFYLVNGANAGTLQLRVANNVGTSSNTHQAHSFMRYELIP
jgi:hypothetical protein